MNEVKFALLNDKAIPPVRKNPTDSGIDFFAPYDIVVEPFAFKIVETGVSVEIPEGYMLLLKPKSRNDHLLGAGVLDAYYHPGEVKIKIFNPTNKPVILYRGDGIAQGIFVKIATPSLVEASVKDLENPSPRSGKGGIVEQLKISWTKESNGR